MATFGLKLLFYILLLGSSLAAFLLVLDNRFKKSKSTKYSWVLQHKNQRFDFAFHGSSRTYNMLDAALFEREAKRPAINIGVGGAGLADNYLLLYLFFKNNNTAKNLVFQIDCFSLSADKSFSDPFHEYIYIPHIRDSIVKTTLVRSSMSRQYYLWNLFPPVAYIEFNSEYNINLFMSSFRTFSKFNKSNGYTPINETAFKVDTIQFPVRKSIDIRDLYYLDKIVQLCRAKNSNIIFYTAPIFDYDKHFKNEETDEVIEQFAKINQIPFIDLKRDLDFANKSNFKDITHLNSTATALFTKKMKSALVPLSK